MIVSSCSCNASNWNEKSLYATAHWTNRLLSGHQRKRSISHAPDLKNKICGTERLSQGYIAQNINNEGSITDYKAIVSTGRVYWKRWACFQIFFLVCRRKNCNDESMLLRTKFKTHFLIRTIPFSIESSWPYNF
jgi:hypothetical protein